MLRTSDYGNIILRITIGALFFIEGLIKIFNPSGFSGFLASLGFPIPMALAWAVLLAELIFGALIIFGWKLKYIVWPLIIEMIVIIFVVILPNFSLSSSDVILNLLWHILAIAVLLNLFLARREK